VHADLFQLALRHGLASHEKEQQDEQLQQAVHGRGHASAPCVDGSCPRRDDQLASSAAASISSCVSTPVQISGSSWSKGASTSRCVGTTQGPVSAPGSWTVASTSRVLASGRV